MSLCKCKLKNLELCDEFSKINSEDCVFPTQKDMKVAFRNLCYGDLYIIGKVWIQSLKFVLIGTKFSLFPTVCAKEEKPPEKPKPTKYKDLPIYDSPHVEYKEHEQKKEKCADADVKLAQCAILPYVAEYRCVLGEHWDSLAEELKVTKDELTTNIYEAASDAKKYMRDPCRPALRKGVVVLGGLTGYLLARNKYLFKKVMYTSLGALAGGFLCYPEETDAVVRTACYHVAKTLILFYNKFNDKNITMKEPFPCEKKKESHVPPPPPPANKKLCEEKK